MIKTKQALVHMMTKAEGSAWLEEVSGLWWLCGTGSGISRVCLNAALSSTRSGDLKKFGCEWRLKKYMQPSKDFDYMWFDEAADILCR